VDGHIGEDIDLSSAKPALPRDLSRLANLDTESDEMFHASVCR